MQLQLQNKIVIITGGSAGIGAAMVRAFGLEGARVHFCGRSAENIERTLQQVQPFSAQLTGTQLDVADQAAVANWLGQIGQFDILIPNVSALSADWEQVLRLDVTASIALCEAAIPYLRASACPAITYISSKAASLAAPHSAAYGAAKAAMAHYFKSLASRLAPQVRVNVLSPGDTFCEAGFWDKVRQKDEAAYQRTIARNPLGRLATPEEIANVAVFLSSPVASFVSGANWYVDGNSCQHVQF